MNTRFRSGLILLVFPGLFVLGSCGTPNGKLESEIEATSTASSARAPSTPTAEASNRFPDVSLLTSERYKYRAFFQKGGGDVTPAVLSDQTRDYDSFVVAVPAAGIQDSWKIENDRLLKDIVEKLLLEVHADMSGKNDTFDLDAALQGAVRAFTGGSTTPISYDIGGAQSQFELVIGPARGIFPDKPEELFLRIELKRKTN